MFHAFQNTIYPGGIGQYIGQPGETNVEFEAKLYKDIYELLYGSGIMSVTYNMPDEVIALYNEWFMDIIDYGFTPSVLSRYSEMLGYFYTYSTYKGGVLNTLNTPVGILNAKIGCN